MIFTTTLSTDLLCPDIAAFRESNGTHEIDRSLEQPSFDASAPPGRIAYIPRLTPAPDPEVLLRLLHSAQNGPQSNTAVADALLADLAAHCYLSRSASIAVVLWALHTYAHDLRDFSPILAFTSDSPESGKSTVLDWLSTVAAEPFTVSNPDARLLPPVIEEYHSTLLIDDFNRRSAVLTDILVTGHYKPKACMISSAKKDQPVKRLSTWCPKAIAKIGALPEVIASRSVEIRMDCKPATLHLKRPEPNRRNESLSNSAAQWVAANAEAIAGLSPQIPDALGNRLRDNWEPLLAIADLIGGDWPILAREAMLKLRNAQDTASSADILLLNAVKIYFEREKVTTAFTEEIIHWMNTEMKLYGTKEKITPAFFARSLRHFNIPTNRTVRRDSIATLGLCKEWLTNAFDRYLCQDPALSKSQTLAPAENLPSLSEVRTGKTASRPE